MLSATLPALIVQYEDDVNMAAHSSLAFGASSVHISLSRSRKHFI